MEQRKVNPWKLQDEYGFSQAIEVTGGERVLYMAGQTSTGPDGNTLDPGYMGAQTKNALDNVETVLREAGLGLENLVRLNYYVTDIERFFTESAPVLGERLGAAGVQPAGTLLGYLNLPIVGGEPKRQICATNVAFGDADGRSLYITACDVVYRIRMKVQGVMPGPKG